MQCYGYISCSKVIVDITIMNYISCIDTLPLVCIWIKLMVKLLHNNYSWCVVIVLSIKIFISHMYEINYFNNIIFKLTKNYISLHLFDVVKC